MTFKSLSKMKKTLGVLIIFLLSFGFLNAQQKTHKVEAKETIYGISKKYGISQDELMDANPFLRQRVLQIGDELVIPGKSNTKEDGRIKPVVTQTDPPETTDFREIEEDDNYIYLKIKPKQTIYSITKDYNVTEEVLRSLNPQLKNGLKTEDIIRIPKKKTTEKAEEEIVPEGMYKVKKGDTVFSLSKDFNVSQDDFYIANPAVQTGGLVVGSYVKIPKKGKNTAVIQDGFIEHKVKKGETIYSITKLYNVSFADLLKHNPQLSEGLKEGMILKVPLPDNADIIKIGEKIKRINDNEINIALLLPFHLDNIAGRAQEKQISADLLIGARIALDSLARSGKVINLRVFDSQGSTETVEKLLATENFSKFDAVIGPLFGSNFKSMATMLAGSGIAVVSPLSNSDDLTGYENVIVSTPTDEFIADAIVQEIVNDYTNQQIRILTDERYLGLSEYFSAKLKKKIPTVDIQTVTDAKKLIQDFNLKTEKLSDGTEVESKEFVPLMTVLISDNNDLGRSYVTRLKEMDAETLRAYGVKFVTAYDIYDSANKENIAVLKNIGFTFSTNRLVNIYGSNEKSAIEQFTDLYCDMPNEYRQIGFDVVYDLVDRMNTRGDVLNNMGGEFTRLATKFKYEKQGKAFVNTAVRTVRLFVPADESPDEE